MFCGKGLEKGITVGVAGTEIHFSSLHPRSLVRRFAHCIGRSTGFRIGPSASVGCTHLCRSASGPVHHDTIMFCVCLDDGATDECSLGKKEVLSPTYDMCEHKEGHGELGDDSIGF